MLTWQSCCAATVSVFGVNEAVADADYRDYMQDLAGDVASVSRSTTIPGCRLAEYWDVRSAHLALNKLNGSQARVPTIVEVRQDLSSPIGWESASRRLLHGLSMPHAKLHCTDQPLLMSLAWHSVSLISVELQAGISGEPLVPLSNDMQCAGALTAACQPAQCAVQPCAAVCLSSRQPARPATC